MKKKSKYARELNKILLGILIVSFFSYIVCIMVSFDYTVVAVLNIHPNYCHLKTRRVT